LLDFNNLFLIFFRLPLSLPAETNQLFGRFVDQ